MGSIELDDLSKCLKLLQELFEDGPASFNWLASPNIVLGSKTPLDSLSEGRGQEVIDLLEGILSKSSS